MALASQRSKAVFFSLVLIWYSSRAYYVFFFFLSNCICICYKGSLLLKSWAQMRINYTMKWKCHHVLSPACQKLWKYCCIICKVSTCMHCDFVFFFIYRLCILYIIHTIDDTSKKYNKIYSIYLHFYKI